MKSEFEIKDTKEIEQILKSATYGTLALCRDNKPYSVPINFTMIGEDIYFHGKKSGKKMSYIGDNPFVSFSVVESYSIIPSYFSTKDSHACPATHLFKSVLIEGKIEIVKEYDVKVKALEALMQKLQPEGGYTPLEDSIYEKRVNGVEIMRLKPYKITAKAKLAQQLSQERYDMIVENLQKRANESDKITLLRMKEKRDHKD